jgi:glycosyltransferase involved in cell wall biosynthesis
VSERSLRINLIGWDNSRGLSHDLRLLREVLEALGHRVHFTAVGPRRRRRTIAALLLHLRLAWQWLRGGAQGSRLFDVNIMLEHVQPAYFGVAQRNLFIPNPEWFSPRDERHLHRFDAVLAKTRVAVATFEARGVRTIYIGFRSSDCLLPEVARQSRFLHLAGASDMKGTRRLLALWRRHPEWPPLLVLQSPSTARDEPPTPDHANLEHRITTLTRIDEIRQLQNSHAFHLCLSETEGWGHYIAEAMSCGAVVLTCDAPPMNELVRPDRGLLVGAGEIGALNAAMRYRFDESALEAAIERVRMMDPLQQASMGAAARAWFEANERNFPGLLQDALQQLT